MVNSVFGSCSLQAVNSLHVFPQSWVCTSDIGEEGKSSLLGDEAAGPVLGRMESDESKLFWSVTTSCIYVEISEIPEILRFWINQQMWQMWWSLWFWGWNNVDFAERCWHGVRVSRFQNASQAGMQVTKSKHVTRLRKYWTNDTADMNAKGKGFIWFGDCDVIVLSVLGTSWILDLFRSKSMESKPAPLSMAMCCVMALNLGLAKTSRSLHVWHGSLDAAFRTVVYFTAYLLLTGGSI